MKKVGVILIILFASYIKIALAQTNDNLPAFIYNVVSFFDWSQIPNGELKIYILNDPAVEKGLIDFINTKTIQSKKIIVKSATLEDIKKDNPNVVYVDIDHKSFIPVLPKDNTLILTFGQDGITKGADITFIENPDGSLKYIYSPSSLELKGLTYESPLSTFGTAAR